MWCKKSFSCKKTSCCWNYDCSSKDVEAYHCDVLWESDGMVSLEKAKSLKFISLVKKAIDNDSKDMV